MKYSLTMAYRAVADLADEPELPHAKFDALQSNPFLSGDSDLGKIVGLNEGVEIGGEYVFPLMVRAGGKRVRVLAGSTLQVDPKYRRSGLGMDLPELRWQKSPSGVALGAGLSQMAVPVHQLLDYNVFLMPRMLMLWKSRAVVEMKLHGVLARVAGAVADAALACYAALMRLGVAVKLRRYAVAEVRPEDADALAACARMMDDDPHAYGEVHDEKWLRWHLTQAFVGPDVPEARSGGSAAPSAGPARLFAVRRDGRPVGFYMTKQRFHPQASHRGFRNVWLGSIIEWQTVPEEASVLPWLLLRAALALRRSGMDAVELPTDDERLLRFFRRLGWRTVGEGNFVIKAGPGSALADDAALKEQTNWRLRPAMGDNGMS